MTEPQGQPPAGAGEAHAADTRAYWRENIKLVCGLLAVWFVVSFGAGILFVDILNTIKLGGFPLGFWFAQQGSIITFVILIFVYSIRMKKIDRKYGVGDE